MGFFSRIFGRSGGGKSEEFGDNRLVRAALEGDVSLARAALADGVAPDDAGGHEIVPLVLALAKGHAEVASVLIEAGADVNRPDPRGGMTALHAAAMHGLAEVVRSLLAGGAPPDVTYGDPPVTPFALAVRRGHREVTRLLLNAGADPNQGVALPSDDRDQAGVRAITHAAAAGDVEAIKLLASYGADPDARKADGLTPLMVAAFRGQLESAQALVEAGANPNLIHAADPSRPFSALDLAAVKGHRPVAEYLEGRGAISAARP